MQGGKYTSMQCARDPAWDANMMTATFWSPPRRPRPQASGPRIALTRLHAHRDWVALRVDALAKSTRES